jgi:hypothetical protein
MTKLPPGSLGRDPLRTSMHLCQSTLNLIGTTVVIFKVRTLRSSWLGGIGGELATGTVHLKLSTCVVAY